MGTEIERKENKVKWIVCIERIPPFTQTRTCCFQFGAVVVMVAFCWIWTAAEVNGHGVVGIVEQEQRCWENLPCGSVKSGNSAVGGLVF